MTRKYQAAWAVVAVVTLLGQAAGAGDSPDGAPQPNRDEAVEAGKVDELIAKLGSVDSAVRDQAASQLMDIGIAALEPLKAAVANGDEDAEVRGRARRLAEEIDKRRWLVRTLVGHKDIVWSVAFSPDGRSLLTAGGANFTRNFGFGGGAGAEDFVNVGWEPGSDFAIRIWDAAAGKELRRLEGHTAMVTAAVWSADGRRIASCGDDNTVRLWDAKTGKLLRTLLGHDQGVWGVWGVAFTPDGGRLVSGARDQTVRLWDVETGKELRRLTCQGRLWSVAVRPDGKLAACGGDEGQIRLWDLDTGRERQPLRGHESTVAALAFSPDGKKLASGGWDSAVRLWDVDAGKEIRTLQGHTSHVEGVAWSPDGKWVLSGALDKTVRLWDAETGAELRVYEGHAAPATKVAFSPDGKHALSGGWDKTVRLWLLPEIRNEAAEHQPKSN
jgi:WD40 repeat protein